MTACEPPGRVKLREKFKRARRAAKSTVKKTQEVSPSGKLGGALVSVRMAIHYSTQGMPWARPKARSLAHIRNERGIMNPNDIIEQLIAQVSEMKFLPPELVDIIKALQPVLAIRLQTMVEKSNRVEGLKVEVPGSWIKQEAYWLPELRQFVDESKTYVIDYHDLHVWLQTCRNTREAMQQAREAKFRAT